MASALPGQTFGEKVRSLALKTALALAFAGAAAHHYAGPKEDTMEPEACVDNANLTEVALKTPRLSRELALMEQLQLTGNSTHGLLKNPDNGIRSCLFPAPENAATASSYSDKLARIARNSDTSVTFHEYFHAAQDINTATANTFSLTQKRMLQSLSCLWRRLPKLMSLQCDRKPITAT